MPLRAYVFLAVVAGLSVYAWRDWFRALCGMLLLLPLYRHPDVPMTLGGINGLCPWNLLMLSVVVGWALSRRHEGHVWDMPRGVVMVLGAFAIIIIVLPFARVAADMGSFPAGRQMSPLELTSECLINPMRCMLPGLLLYDGCRTRGRVLTAIVCILLGCWACTPLIFSHVPLSTLVGQGDFLLDRITLAYKTGLGANAGGTLLAAAFWGILVSLVIWRRWGLRLVAVAAAVSAFLGMALCYSRAAYIVTLVVGLAFAVLRWRGLLWILPVATVVVVLAAPSIVTRLSMGFDEADITGESVTDWKQVTASRATDIWPVVIAAIERSPLIGHGRLAIRRSPMFEVITEKEKRGFGHAHNAYMDMLLDAGAIGLATALVLFGWIAVTAVRFLRDRRDPLVTLVGAVSLALLSVVLVGGFSGQSMFPNMLTVPLWCTAGILVRLSVAMNRQAVALRERSLLPTATV
jgi:hypothetical protein